jgi:FixJ family two-component response regulator
MRELIVVLDDDSSTLKGIGRILTINGFDTELFSSVEDFLSRARLDKAICLVLDINLDGKSGIDLRRQLTRSGILIPVIYMTANDSDAIRKAAIDTGCVAYLTKPFPAISLMSAIKKVATDSNRAQ